MRSIKQLIEERLDAGDAPEAAWRAFEAAYPSRHCGWNYVQKIARNWARAKEDEK